MKYRRAMLLADLRVDPTIALSALCRVAPALERVLVLARVPWSGTWWSSEPERRADEREQAALDRWQTAAAALAPSTEVRSLPELPLEALIDLALTERVDLLVAGARSFDSARLLTSAARRLAIAALWPAGDARSAPIEHVFCAAIGQRSRASIAAFLREHADPSLEVAIAGPARTPTGELARALQVAGIHARVAVIPGTVLSLGAALDAAGRHRPVDLIVFARVPLPLLLGYPWPGPVLLVPAIASGQRTRALDMTDAVDVGGTSRVRIDEVTLVGTLAPAANLLLAFISEGQVLATVTATASGEVELPPGITAIWLGVVRVVDDTPGDVLAAAEQQFAVLRPGERPLVLFDSELPDELLRIVREIPGTAAVEPLAVRLRPTRRASAIRQRLQAAGIRSHVIDACTVLDEGEAHDVTEANDPVRLRRVAARMRAAGFPIESVFHRGLARPEQLTDAPVIPIAGNRVELELDNAQARAWLLDAIAQSRESANVQVYMALDDEIGRAVEAALAGAGARGVTVRVLVDSLHGMHGSFGTENPLLSRLAGRPGVELRVSRPLTKLPSVLDLKQRDHRKIAIVDGRVALIGGRNLSHEYYTGFDEVRLSAEATWRQVPWLDAGARIEGPAVAAIAASFVEAWTEAGGAPFHIESPAPVGSTVARVVVHRGLRDARTLEAYLELIERARSHVYAVNGFPYVLELQHALLNALRRGVQVRALSGHLTPAHDGTPFAGPWSSARTAVTEFVHSRLDPLVDAGGEVYLFAQRGVSSWTPGLGAVYPHVHAKVMSADGLRCAVGSANFDVTSSYWESDLMLVLEDPAVARSLEQRLDQLIASSTRVNRDDPAWRERARRRSWMRKWPGLLAF